MSGMDIYNLFFSGLQKFWSHRCLGAPSSTYKNLVENRSKLLSRLLVNYYQVSLNILASISHLGSYRYLTTIFFSPLYKYACHYLQHLRNSFTLLCRHSCGPVLCSAYFTGMSNPAHHWHWSSLQSPTYPNTLLQLMPKRLNLCSRFNTLDYKFVV